MAKHPGFDPFKELWDSDDTDLAKWIRSVANGFYEIGLQGMEWQVAAFIGVPLAELVSVLKLAGLSDEELDQVARKRPERVFWLHLAEAEDAGELTLILEKFDAFGENGPTMSAMGNAISEFQPKTMFDLVRELSSDDFWYLATKAKTSDLTQPKERSLLASCAKRRSSGGQITAPQAQWAVAIIQRLIDSKVISDSEFDEDVKENLRILSNLNLR